MKFFNWKHSRGQIKHKAVLPLMAVMKLFNLVVPNLVQHVTRSVNRNFSFKNPETFSDKNITVILPLSVVHINY
jgi:hypothetical protein